MRYNSIVPDEIPKRVDVMEYLEYREFLRDWYKEGKRRSRTMSYRFLSQKTGIDASWLVRIFQQEGHLADEVVPAFVKLCEFDARRTEYFKALHRFCKTDSDSERRRCFDDMMRLRDMTSRQLRDDEYAYYSHWIPSALRALVGLLRETTDIVHIGQKLIPKVEAKEIKEAIHLLHKLGLVAEDGHGGWNITDRILTTGAEVGSDALRNYQRQVLYLAENSLAEQMPGERDISTLTLTLSCEDLPEIKERISQLRRSLLQLARNAHKADRVFALNVSLFALSEKLDASELESTGQKVDS